MVQYIIFKDKVQTEYKTSICSKATLLIFFINFLQFTIPFLVAYRTQGFWLKTDSYEEQPDIQFIYEYAIILETDNAHEPIICTTFSPIVEITEEYNKCNIMKVREEDFNKDGKYDKMYFEVDAHVGSANVYNVMIILLFDYKLSSHSWFQMQTMGWLEIDSALGGGRLDVTADLKLHQRDPLGHKGRDTRFNSSIINANYSHEYSLFKILADYSERNVTTRIENEYYVWTRGRIEEQPFIFSLQLTYGVETVIYRPGTWQVIKMSWIQYLALLYISFIFGKKLKHFLLDNRLVNNVKINPWKKTF